MYYAIAIVDFACRPYMGDEDRRSSAVVEAATLEKVTADLVASWDTKSVDYNKDIHLAAEDALDEFEGECGLSLHYYVMGDLPLVEAIAKAKADSGATFEFGEESGMGMISFFESKPTNEQLEAVQNRTDVRLAQMGGNGW